MEKEEILVVRVSVINPAGDKTFTGRNFHFVRAMALEIGINTEVIRSMVMQTVLAQELTFPHVINVLFPVAHELKIIV
jgi:hypothetical protein